MRRDRVTVRVVLDTTALLAYARLDDAAVGELIAMVEEEGAASIVGVPAAAFLSAYPALAGADRARLVEMVTTVDGVTAILPLLGADTVEVAEKAGRLGGAGSAHAVVEVVRRGALLATYAGAAARTELPDGAVLDL